MFNVSNGMNVSRIGVGLMTAILTVFSWIRWRPTRSTATGTATIPPHPHGLRSEYSFRGNGVG